MRRRMALLVGVGAALAVLLAGTAAQAHKLKVFAMGDGQQITGYVYYPGGGRAQSLTVKALGPDGAILGEVTTDNQGRFALSAKFRCDHRLVVQTPDGHKAAYLLKASELAAELPPLPGAPTKPITAQEPAADALGTFAEEEQDVVALDDLVWSTVRKRMQSLVQDAVREQVQPLREQIEGYEERRRLHDILGGIGYIVGVAGIAFYFLGVSRRRARGPDPPPN